MTLLVFSLNWEDPQRAGVRKYKNLEEFQEENQWFDYNELEEKEDFKDGVCYQQGMNPTGSSREKTLN